METTRDDILIVTGISVVAGQTIRIQGATRSRDGTIAPIDLTLTLPTAGTAGSISTSLPEGEILSLTAFVAAAQSFAADNYMLATIRRGATTVGTHKAILLQGYVGSWEPLAWPEKPERSLTDCSPRVTSTAVADPDPGLAQTINFVPYSIVRLSAITFTLACSATVATRRAYVSQRAAQNTMASATQIASETYTYYFNRYPAAISDAGLLARNTPFPTTEWVLSPTVVIAAANIQAADEISGITLFYDAGVFPFALNLG